MPTSTSSKPSNRTPKPKPEQDDMTKPTDNTPIPDDVKARIDAARRLRASVHTKPSIEAPVLGRIIEETENDRTIELPYDVLQHEERVTKVTMSGSKEATWDVWQAYGRTVPVLLILNPNAFTSAHETALRTERDIDRQNRVIRGALKKHTSDGEIYFTMGRSDAEADDVITYAIEFLRGHGIQATRALRFTPYLSRGQW